MHVVTQKRIWAAKSTWPRAAKALDTWYRLAKAAAPTDFASLKLTFPATDKVGELHVFDIGGNKLRLIAVVDYRFQKIFIRHILSHTEYADGRWRTT